MLDRVRNVTDVPENALYQEFKKSLELVSFHTRCRQPKLGQN